MIDGFMGKETTDVMDVFYAFRGKRHNSLTSFASFGKSTITGKNNVRL